jgi:hypothetical protein
MSNHDKRTFYTFQAFGMLCRDPSINIVRGRSWLPLRVGHKTKMKSVFNPENNLGFVKDIIPKDFV